MRDKATGRGRGFGFVRMVLQDDDEATRIKDKIIYQNSKEGHYILDKKVDVKSADDYQGKTTNPMHHAPPMGGGISGGGGGGAGAPLIQKPNPYVIAETK